MNESLRRAVIVVSIVMAVSGISHGLFEILQGSRPTGSAFIAAIGEEHQMWEHGQEGAFTIVPNFLITGILAVATSIAIIIWSFVGLTRKSGAWILFLLFILLFLFGGGVAQLPFFLILCWFASRIVRPGPWLERRAVTTGRFRKFWRPGIVLFAVLMLFALQVAVTGWIPGVRNPDTALAVTLGCVLVSLLLSPVIFTSAVIDGMETS